VKSNSRPVGIHLEPLGDFSERLARYERILQFNGINSVRLTSSDLDFWDKVRDLRLFIYYWGQWDTSRQNAKAIIPIVETEMQVPCFPNMKTCWSFDDKIRQYILMQSHNQIMVKSWAFWEKEAALEWATDATLPVIFKLTGGAGSLNVLLVRNRKQLFKLIQIMFGKGVYSESLPWGGLAKQHIISEVIRRVMILKRKLLKKPLKHNQLIPNWQIHKNYVLFQEFLPDNQFDTRVTTIGKRAFAFRRFNRPNDFRASGSGNLNYDMKCINPEIIQKALDLSQQFGFQTMAYDFLVSPDGQNKICEFSYGYADTAIFDCDGFWDLNMNWHAGHFWPQYLVLMDLLEDPNLQQPDLT
jgi:glutathione synthase/RimK-type ligase-like ATP-grasp enzyme